MLFASFCYADAFLTQNPSFSGWCSIGLGLGLAFWFPPETPAGIQSIKTITYQSSPACFYLSIIIFVYLLCAELVIFDREREDGLYGTVPYVVASFVSYLPANLAFPSLYAVIGELEFCFRSDRSLTNAGVPQCTS